ncbi:hypothetical protein [Rhodococcus sp. 11-3]|uniref:DUF7427 family protein n=1 Tax=Rhodococcus sp. 11-3 TaxID=2854796 RepID=UPI0020419EEE|nr:hypothetical protein [Rhodococcus sp. 11-3]USC17052.1 hypothetical protein KZJ41_09370 [Rhodococcus sp. 11-3]
MTGERAWAWLAGGVIAYEIMADEDQLLSNAVDRWLKSHPLATHVAVVVTAAHLLNLIPERLDPFHHISLLGAVLRLRR